MVQRSKRSMSLQKAGEMNDAVKQFETLVRRWSAEVPIGGPVYLALDPLNHALGLMRRVLNAEADGRAFERRYGEGGIE